MDLFKFIFFAIFLVALCRSYIAAGKVSYESKLAKAFGKLAGTLGNTGMRMLFGYFFAELPESAYNDVVRNHTAIRAKQYRECLILGSVVALGFTWLTMYVLVLPFLFYYILCGVEYLISFVHNLFAHHIKDISASNRTATANSAMGMEVRENESNLNYLDERKPFAFFRYYGKL